jgi:hypothetical protein
MNLEDHSHIPIRLTYQESNRNLIIHEAGHATAIYHGNKQKGLPPVYFQILITPVQSDESPSPFLSVYNSAYSVDIEGGRLVHPFPSSFEESTKGFSPDQTLAYQRAFEADMVNMLVGPLAEAKFIALLDGELFNQRMINLAALQYYGGVSDIESVNQYLTCLNIPVKQRKQKVTELLSSAYCFVEARPNWLAITALADYLASVDNTVIDYADILDVLNRPINVHVTI